MAEAIINARLNEDWQTFSAGTKPAGFVHPYAIQVLMELAFDTWVAQNTWKNIAKRRLPRL